MEAPPRGRSVWTMLWWALVKAFVEENLFSRMVLNVLAALSTLLVSGARFDISNILTVLTLNFCIAHITQLTCPDFWVSVSHSSLMFRQNLPIQMLSVGFGASLLVCACDSSFQILDCGCVQSYLFSGWVQLWVHAFFNLDAGFFCFVHMFAPLWCLNSWGILGITWSWFIDLFSGSDKYRSSCERETKEWKRSERELTDNGFLGIGQDEVGLKSELVEAQEGCTWEVYNSAEEKARVSSERARRAEAAAGLAAAQVSFLRALHV